MRSDVCPLCVLSIDRSDDPSGALEWLAKKIQDVTLLPANHGEVSQQRQRAVMHDRLSPGLVVYTKLYTNLKPRVHHV